METSTKTCRKTFRLRITQCPNEKWWYRNHIGKEYTAARGSISDYYIPIVDKYVSKTDCEVLSELPVLEHLCPSCNSRKVFRNNTGMRICDSCGSRWLRAK